ncbi:MAG: cytidylate kinase-like family protein [Desulfobacterales bacterium]|jgi:cytidylate kinase
MAINKPKEKYVPGTHGKKRPEAAPLAAQFIREWEQGRHKLKGKKIEPSEISPTICFSRKIGGGALEISDFLAEKIYYRVVDRELLEHIAKDKELSKKTVEFFDERYPGKMSELGSMLFGEKSFIMSEYVQNLVSAVFTFANMGSSIFVGRGAHLILPRDRVLAVRIICSDEYRIERLANILDVEESEAEKLLHKIDHEQRAFFKKVFGKKDASPYEFDMVINSDFITGPAEAAEIIACAFKEKFAAELEGKPFSNRNAA